MESEQRSIVLYLPSSSPGERSNWTPQTFASSVRASPRSGATLLLAFSGQFTKI